MDKNIIKNNIIIVGGGMNGLTLSILLAKDGFNITCVDSSRAQNNEADGRTTAISYGSSLILQSAGIWDQIKPHACPIKKIKIMDGHSPSLLTFDLHQNFGKKKHQEKYDAFGWIVENKILYQVLFDECQKLKNLHHQTGCKVTAIQYDSDHASIFLDNDETLKCALVVGADGRQSFTRNAANISVKKWSYNQKAAVFVATHRNPHHNIAIEHFKTHGPFAILPMMDHEDGAHQSAVVWTLEKNQPDSILKNPESLKAAMNERFPNSYGEVTHVNSPQIYPLNFNHAYTYIAPRTVLIGDAAHGIHPIAGQGLNIGLQDVKALHRVLIGLKNNDQDIGSQDNLKEYEILRMPDNTMMAAATDLLNRLFSNNLSAAKLIRKNGLKIIEKFPRSKKFFINRAMGIKDS